MIANQSYASIMVHVDVERGSAARVKVGAALAKRLQALLIGVAFLTPSETSVVHEATLNQLNTTSNPDTSAKLIQLAHAKKHFFETAEPYKRLEWRECADFPTSALLHEARAADLLVIEKGSRMPPLSWPVDTPRLLLQIGRPVLMIPRAWDHIEPTTVLVGWKDTREARRAVRDSLPVLQHANRVTLFEAGAPGDERDALRRLADVEAYLARYGISGCLKLYSNDLDAPAEAMMRIARDEGITLIVAGAYGHSRLGEWVFGGVTADLLTRCPLPCLLSH